MYCANRFEKNAQNSVSVRGFQFFCQKNAKKHIKYLTFGFVFAIILCARVRTQVRKMFGGRVYALAIVYAFANQKGGVGKTTSAVNIAAAIGSLGKKTLLVDMDPQGNATSGVGVSKKSVSKSAYDVIVNGVPAKNVIKKTKFKKLDILPATIALAGAELELVDKEKREFFLRDALAEVKDDYDFVFIDCPPSLGLLTINSLCAGDGVIVPMQCEYFALEGLSQLTVTIAQVKRLYNPALELSGVIITMFDGRLNLSLQVLEQIKKHFKGKIFRVPVPRNVRLSEAPSYGMPAIYYDKYSRGAMAYTDIAKEIAGV